MFFINIRSLLWFAPFFQKFGVNTSGRPHWHFVYALCVIAVVELINRKIGTKDILQRPLYADDLAFVADRKDILRTADKVEGYIQLTWTDNKFVEDAGNVCGTNKERARNTPGWEETFILFHSWPESQSASLH